MMRISTDEGGHRCMECGGRAQRRHRFRVTKRPRRAQSRPTRRGVADGASAPEPIRQAFRTKAASAPIALSRCACPRTPRGARKQVAALHGARRRPPSRRSGAANAKHDTALVGAVICGISFTLAKRVAPMLYRRPCASALQGGSRETGRAEAPRKRYSLALQIALGMIGALRVLERRPGQTSQLPTTVFGKQPLDASPLRQKPLKPDGAAKGSVLSIGKYLPIIRTDPLLVRPDLFTARRSLAQPAETVALRSPPRSV